MNHGIRKQESILFKNTDLKAGQPGCCEDSIR